MLSAQFSEAKLMLVGLQETRSRQGGRSQAGDYCRVIPDLNSPAAGDIELWFNTRIPWDPIDPLTVLTAEHATIAGTGPHYIIVNICAPWLKIDVVVAHAPHNWDLKKHNKTKLDGTELEDTEMQSVKFWDHLTDTLAKRPLPHCPLIVLADVNIELSHAQICYRGVGEHQAAREATSYAGIFADRVETHIFALPATYRTCHERPRRTFAGKCCHRRIDFVGVPFTWLAGVTTSKVFEHFDNLFQGPFPRASLGQGPHRTPKNCAQGTKA